ncbi:PPK2 family polyphosphate kinase [Methylocella sp.]|uniref:PPK2 family polyphosphate kinase n=1 Tax=Methylocella sp. TaxID=1978226 RepID=UPI003784F153
MARTDFFKLLRVAPGESAGLASRDPAATAGLSRQDAASALGPVSERLAHLQNLLYAGREHALLVVLQGMDAAGKDGTIRHAFAPFNPQGVIVTSFKAPTEEEKRHDFLWRVHAHAPELGMTAIFNRSHYEDYLVGRGAGRLDGRAGARLLRQIRDFEALLADNGVKILKFFLHISKEEQLARFAKRLRDPDKNWKIAESDYATRLRWDDFQRAYEEALSETSAPDAPWLVIPADQKWYRDAVVMDITAAALDALDMRYPKPPVDLAMIERKYHAAVAEQKSGENGRKAEKNGRGGKADAPPDGAG